MANEVAEYVKKISAASPTEALNIALAEVKRAEALALQAATDYKALAEVEFDAKGVIVKANLGGLWRLAQMYAGSGLVPKQYQQNPNNCFIACQMALRLRIDPFAYMQNSYIVYEKPGVEAKLAVAMLNTSGKIKGRLRYEYERIPHADAQKLWQANSPPRGAKGAVTISCTAIARDAESDSDVCATVTWEMVIAEGWLGKSGSKWKTIPDVMFPYRSASFLIKQFYPEVLLGMDFADELLDEGVTVNSTVTRTVSDLGALIESELEEGGKNGELAAPKTEANGTNGTAKTAPKEAKAEVKTDPPKRGKKKEEHAKVETLAEGDIPNDEDEPGKMTEWQENPDADPVR